MAVRRKALMEGCRFGRLIVASFAGKDEYGQPLWNCLCDCGNKCVRIGGQLRLLEKHGRRQSCGCWRNELAAERRRAASTHGLTKETFAYPKLYDVWRQMLQRCENPRHKDYPAYGGRGIAVCTAWHNPNKFITWCVNSGYQEGLTIERKNVNGNYVGLNCTWVPNTLQSRNCRKNRVLRFDGRKMCVSEWANYLEIHVQTLLGRLRNGWSVERTLTTKPVIGRNQFWSV